MKSKLPQIKIIPFLIILWILLSLVTFFLLVQHQTNRFDFYPRWVGARSVLNGESPYSNKATTKIQEDMFGHKLRQNVDQHRFAYNPLITWLLLPFWILPFPIAASLWSGFQFLIMLILPIWIISLLGWKIKPYKLILILFFSLFIFRYPINIYILGQFIPLSLLCLVSVWHGIVHKNKLFILFGLIFSFIRPEIVILPLLFFVVYCWKLGFTKLIFEVFGAIVFLWMFTRFWIGPWELDFINGIVAYSEYSNMIWPIYFWKNNIIAVAIIAILILWLLWIRTRVKNLNENEKIGWQLSFILLANLLLCPQTGNYTLYFVLISVWMILWVFKNYFWVELIVLFTLCLPWVFYFSRPGLLFGEQLFIPFLYLVLLSIALSIRSKVLPQKTASLFLQYSDI